MAPASPTSSVMVSDLPDSELNYSINLKSTPIVRGWRGDTPSMQDVIDVAESVGDGGDPYVILCHFFEQSQEHFANKNSVFAQMRDDDGRTPLHIAAMQGALLAVKGLAEYGFDVDGRDKHELAPLHHAAFSGHVQVIRLLILLGCTLSPKGIKGLTPSHYAAHNGKVEALMALQDLGTDVVSEVGEGRLTALHIAAKEGQHWSLYCLLQLGADMECRNSKGETALIYAAKHGQVNTVMELCELGAKVEARTYRQEVEVGAGMSALHWAGYYGYRELAVKLVTLHGARVEARCDLGMTPLHHATVMGQVRTMKALVKECGAYVNSASSNGLMTAVHYAAREGSLRAIKCLRHLKADAEQRNKFGRHALHYAYQSGDKMVIDEMIAWRMDASKTLIIAGVPKQESLRWTASFLPAWAESAATLFPENWFKPPDVGTAGRVVASRQGSEEESSSSEDEDGLERGELLQRGSTSVFKGTAKEMDVAFSAVKAAANAAQDAAKQIFSVVGCQMDTDVRADEYIYDESQ